MEVNGRINLSILHAQKCGVNFPWIMCNYILYNKQPEKCSFEEGVYWIDMSKDIIGRVI